MTSYRGNPLPFKLFPHHNSVSSGVGFYSSLPLIWLIWIIVYDLGDLEDLFDYLSKSNRSNRPDN